jgi:hypothetical protein
MIPEIIKSDGQNNDGTTIYVTHHRSLYFFPARATDPATHKKNIKPEPKNQTGKGLKKRKTGKNQIKKYEETLFLSQFRSFSYFFFPLRSLTNRKLWNHRLKRVTHKTF